MVPESNWTKPTERCPHPERWSAWDAQSSEVEVVGLVAAFVRALQPDYVVETGTCLGYTAKAIGSVLASSGRGRLDTLETLPNRADIARERCRDLPVTVWVEDSMQFTPTEPIGFAWLDSLTALRVAEFNRYRPWMRPGTIVGFHDTAPHHGPWSHELSLLEGTRMISLPTPRGVAFVEII